ncbi:MAG: hypothetical protein ACKODX_02320 [Gemmata sp.]
MLLICPNCRSGLQVPDGTTALVRCPACTQVFSPAAGAAPAEEPKAPKPAAPKAKGAAKAGPKPEPKLENRDFDPPDPEEDKKRRRKPRRDPDDDSLSPAERAARRAAFSRAAWGCKLIWISFALFMLSMALVIVFFFQSAFLAPLPLLITLAGLIGLVNWLLAAAGVGLCLTGPRAPGHLGYGIAAAAAVLLHLGFLLILVAGGREASVGKATEEAGGAAGNARWGLLPTRLDATMFYLTAAAYRDAQGAVPKGPMTLSMITGVLEMTRTVCILMLLSRLARAALDEDLAHKCTRAAGIASAGPGAIALLIFLFVGAMIETSAGTGTFTMILFATVNMSAYAIVNATIFPALMAAREVTDACEEPYQSLVPQL